MKARDPWRSRIVGEGEEDPAKLVPHPANWRAHPPGQQAALEDALGRIGWVQRVVVNRRTGRIVDGHLRVELALARGERSVPVVYVDLAPEEERVVLATFDPIGALAEANREALEGLLASVADQVPADLVPAPAPPRRSRARRRCCRDDGSTDEALA